MRPSFLEGLDLPTERGTIRVPIPWALRCQLASTSDTAPVGVAPAGMAPAVLLSLVPLEAQVVDMCEGGLSTLCQSGLDTGIKLNPTNRESNENKITQSMASQSTNSSPFTPPTMYNQPTTPATTAYSPYHVTKNILTESASHPFLTSLGLCVYTDILL